MASLEDIHKMPNKPYGGAPMKLYVIAEKKKVSVMKWDLSKSPPTPLADSVFSNKIVAITDGKTVSTCFLFEENAHKFSLERYYSIANFGIRKGRLELNKEARIFKSSPFCVSEELVLKGKALLFPEEKCLEFGEEPSSGLVSITGKVIRVLNSRVETKTSKVMRELTLEHGTRMIPVTLWNEATLNEFKVGEYVMMRSMRPYNYHGFRLCSTADTIISEPSRRTKTLKIVGSTEEVKNGEYTVLTEEGQMFQVKETVWRDPERTDFEIAAVIHKDHILAYTVTEEEGEKKEDEQKKDRC